MFIFIFKRRRDRSAIVMLGRGDDPIGRHGGEGMGDQRRFTPSDRRALEGVAGGNVANQSDEAIIIG
jgi:hypothetical protein